MLITQGRMRCTEILAIIRARTVGPIGLERFCIRRRRLFEKKVHLPLGDNLTSLSSFLMSSSFTLLLMQLFNGLRCAPGLSKVVSPCDNSTGRIELLLLDRRTVGRAPFSGESVGGKMLIVGVLLDMFYLIQDVNSRRRLSICIDIACSTSFLTLFQNHTQQAFVKLRVGSFVHGRSRFHSDYNIYLFFS